MQVVKLVLIEVFRRSLDNFATETSLYRIRLLDSVHFLGAWIRGELGLLPSAQLGDMPLRMVEPQTAAGLVSVACFNRVDRAPMPWVLLACAAALRVEAPGGAAHGLARLLRAEPAEALQVPPLHPLEIFHIGCFSITILILRAEGFLGII